MTMPGSGNARRSRMLRMGLIFGAFIAISLVSGLFQDDDENESATNTVDELEEEIEVSQRAPEVSSMGEQVMVSGLSYDVTHASVSDSLPTAGLSEQPQEEYLLITMYVTNSSNEPRTELKGIDFTLTDSENHTFNVIETLSPYFGESWSTLQPGITGYRGLVFQIPADSELEYKLLVGDVNIVPLGAGNNFDVME